MYNDISYHLRHNLLLGIGTLEERHKHLLHRRRHIHPKKFARLVATKHRYRYTHIYTQHNTQTQQGDHLLYNDTVN